MSEEWSFDQGKWKFTGDLFPTSSDSLNLASAGVPGLDPSLAGIPGLDPSLLHDPAGNNSKSWSEHDTDAEHDDTEPEYDDTKPEHDTDVDSDTIEVVSYSTGAYSTGGYQKTASATTNHSALPPPLKKTTAAAAAKRRTIDEATAGGPSKKPKVSPAGKSSKSAEKATVWPTPNPTPSSVSDTEIWQNESGDLVVPRASAAYGMMKLVLELEKRAMEAEQGKIAAEQRASAAEKRAIKAEQDKTKGVMGGSKWSTGRRK
ncbi:hypothetical protein LTR99_003854 [Exophiala xenobiotica]|nr:hypothetical protein LTR99_003854 [Exophiala xenobiotica]KAK5435322.1 hypothetical protein LTR34_002825 [Exophiala xenobiotica]KAK5548969.1 hypothetical protein LTR23_000798 [Chaetothyriales sp. CCFEE 6169]